MAKALVAAVGGIVILVQLALADEAFSFDEASGIWTAIIAAITTLGVYPTPNKTTT